MTPRVLRCQHCTKKAYYRVQAGVTWVSCMKCGKPVQVTDNRPRGEERRLIETLEA